MLPLNNNVPENLPVDCEPVDSTKPDLTDLIPLVQALERVYLRLQAEGYRWQDGELIPPGKSPES